MQSIYVIHYIIKSKVQNHMIMVMSKITGPKYMVISIGAEKAIDKIYHHFIIRIFKKKL